LPITAGIRFEQIILTGKKTPAQVIRLPAGVKLYYSGILSNRK